METLSNRSENGRNTENDRRLERYGDYIQGFLLTTAGFVYFSGAQTDNSPLPDRGHVAM